MKLHKKVFSKNLTNRFFANIMPLQKEIEVRSHAKVLTKTTNAKGEVMITNTISVNRSAYKRSFRVLTAVVTVLFFCSVTFTAFATTNTRSNASNKNKVTGITEIFGFIPEKGLAFLSLNDIPEGETSVKFFRITYKTVNEKVAVPYKTIEVSDDTLYVGEEKIVTKGVDGVKQVVRVDKYFDGELKENLYFEETVVSETVNEVKKVGTKERATLAAFKNNDAPISDLKVPEDLVLDKNGIPVDYAYCVKGKATAYTGDPATASGRKPMPGHIAVDPKEFPYGTELYVVSADGSYVYGYCIAADTGGFVKRGNTDIDLYMDNVEMCRDWGNRNVKIYVLN